MYGSLLRARSSFISLLGLAEERPKDSGVPDVLRRQEERSKAAIRGPKVRETGPWKTTLVAQNVFRLRVTDGLRPVLMVRRQPRP